MATTRSTLSGRAPGGAGSQPMTDDGQGVGDYRGEARGPGPQVMAADMLIGDNIRNGANEKLGEITDIMIDVPTGRVAYAVMSVGGVLGVGAKLFAIPWSALRLDTENKCFRMNV